MLLCEPSKTAMRGWAIGGNGASALCSIQKETKPGILRKGMSAPFGPMRRKASLSDSSASFSLLGLSTMAYFTRLMRSSLLEITNSDFVRTARAKGLPPTRIFLRHQLRNAILPVVTVLGPQIALITTGGFVVELVFAIPGLGVAGELLRRVAGQACEELAATW